MSTARTSTTALGVRVSDEASGIRSRASSRRAPDNPGRVAVAAANRLASPRRADVAAEVVRRETRGNQRIWAMARPGLEPGTPRFSAACPPRANVVDLQRNHERVLRRGVAEDSRTFVVIAPLSGTRSRTCAQMTYPPASAVIRTCGGYAPPLPRLGWQARLGA